MADVQSSSKMEIWAGVLSSYSMRLYCSIGRGGGGIWIVILFHRVVTAQSWDFTLIIVT